MLKVEFKYKNALYNIQAKEDDKMREICNKFTQKSQIDINDIYFLYSGDRLNLDLNLSQIINKLDKERQIMTIIAIDNKIQLNNNNIIKPPHIICPICKECARFEINNYRIKIFNCKNGHVFDNILINDFEKTQIIDESKIICNWCNTQNKADAYDKEMYFCNLCRENLCPLCKVNHPSNHDIIKYDKKYYTCNKHNKEYNSYCLICNEDICLFCKKEHNNHDLIPYEQIIPEVTNNSEFNSELEFCIKELKSRLQIVIDRFNNVINNIEEYIKISKNIYNNYNINNINYNIIQNFNYNNEFIKGNSYIFKDIQKLVEDYTYKEFIPTIFKMYDEINGINESDFIYNNIQNDEIETKTKQNEKLTIVNKLNEAEKMSFYHSVMDNNLGEFKAYLSGDFGKKYDIFEELSVKGLGWTAIHYSMHHGKWDIINYIIDYLKSKNQLESAFRMKTKDGRCPILCLLRSSDLKVKEKKYFFEKIMHKYPFPISLDVMEELRKRNFDDLISKFNLKIDFLE